MDGSSEKLIHYLNPNHPPLSSYVMDDNNAASPQFTAATPPPLFAHSFFYSSQLLVMPPLPESKGCQGPRQSYRRSDGWAVK